MQLHRKVQQIKEAGVQAGVVINPSTPVTSVRWILEYIDFVLIMSVNPGFGGQHFIPNSLDRIRAMRGLIDELDLAVLVEVDGGVNPGTIQQVAAAGANVFVAGSAIFGSEDYRQTIKQLKKLIA